MITTYHLRSLGLARVVLEDRGEAGARLVAYQIATPAEPILIEGEDIEECQDMLARRLAPPRVPTPAGRYP
jgi:hypothetical protein